MFLFVLLLVAVIVLVLVDSVVGTDSVTDTDTTNNETNKAVPTQQHCEKNNICCTMLPTSTVNVDDIAGLPDKEVLLDDMLAYLRDLPNTKEQQEITMGKIPSCGTLSKFYMDAMLRANKTGERYGQATFNHLLQVRPGLANMVRGTNSDVFHMNGPADDFDRWDRFAVLIETNWYC